MMVNIMLNTRRCKLHLPFLIRANSDPRFAFSRRMGLQAARKVFDVRRVVAEDENTMGAAHLKLGGILQHVFYATVVLVMDLCVNKDDDQGRLVEVREALQVMQNASSCSQMGTKFLDSLMSILRKHHVKLPTVHGVNNDLPNTDGHMDRSASHKPLHAHNDTVISQGLSNHPAHTQRRS